jgi:hypothetical protein
MPTMRSDIADPRATSEASPAAAAPLIDLAAESLAAASVHGAAALERALAVRLAAHLQSGQAGLVGDAMEAAPSVAVARALSRGLIEAWALASRPAGGEGVAAALFALPVVIIVGGEERALRDNPAPAVDAILADTEPLAALLRGARALPGHQAFALANALVAPDAIDVPRLSALLAWQELAAGAAPARRDLPPAPIVVQPGEQSVHLRFLIGTALVGTGADAAAADTSGWAMPFARELSRQLSAPGLSVLALPRLPQSPPAALQHGRAAQREVAAQLFVSNAIRKLRAATGEPAAVISAHRAAGAPGGGELRLSLSSPFDARAAEGFRCPLFATDRVGDVAAMLGDLLRDCRVADVRILPGVHADRDPQTGLALLFKADAVPAAAQTSFH